MLVILLTVPRVLSEQQSYLFGSKMSNHFERIFLSVSWVFIRAKTGFGSWTAQTIFFIQSI